VLLFAALLAVSAAGYGQQFGTRIDVSAIEVSVSVRDASGNVPRDLKPDDFVLLEDGKPQRIIGLSYGQSSSPDAATPAPPRRVVVFLQQSLSTTDGLRGAVKALVPEAERLTAMGEVEVITDVPSPHSLLGPTRDAASLRAIFTRLGGEIEGREELIRMRREFLIGNPSTHDESGAAEGLAGRDQIRMRARQEWFRLRARQDAMLAWMSRYPRRESGGAPRALVLVTDGFDLAPADFYKVDPGDRRTNLRDELRAMNASARQDEIAQALAAQGWTILSFATGSHVIRLTRFDDATHESGPRREFVDVLHNTHQSVINKAPLDPLRTLADATGGSVLTDPSKIGERLEDLDQRVVITYQVDRPSDDKLRRVEVRAVRAGLVVTAQKWVGGGSPEAMTEATAAVMATALASAEGVEHDELPVTCSIKLGPMTKGVRNSDIDVRVDLTPIEELLAGIDSGTLRFTLAVVTPKAQPFTSTNRLDHLDFSSKSGWSTTLHLQHRDGAKMAVIAEETSTGAWGGCAVR